MGDFGTNFADTYLAADRQRDARAQEITNQIMQQRAQDMAQKQQDLAQSQFDYKKQQDEANTQSDEEDKKNSRLLGTENAVTSILANPYNPPAVNMTIARLRYEQHRKYFPDDLPGSFEEFVRGLSGQQPGGKTGDQGDQGAPQQGQPSAPSPAVMQSQPQAGPMPGPMLGAPPSGLPGGIDPQSFLAPSGPSPMMPGAGMSPLDPQTMMQPSPMAPPPAGPPPGAGPMMGPMMGAPTPPPGLPPMGMGPGMGPAASGPAAPMPAGPAAGPMSGADLASLAGFPDPNQPGLRGQNLQSQIAHRGVQEQQAAEREKRLAATGEARQKLAERIANLNEPYLKARAQKTAEEADALPDTLEAKADHLDRLNDHLDFMEGLAKEQLGVSKQNLELRKKQFIAVNGGREAGNLFKARQASLQAEKSVELDTQRLAQLKAQRNAIMAKPDYDAVPAMQQQAQAVQDQAEAVQQQLTVHKQNQNVADRLRQQIEGDLTSAGFLRGTATQSTEKPTPKRRPTPGRPDANSFMLQYGIR